MHKDINIITEGGLAWRLPGQDKLGFKMPRDDSGVIIPSAGGHLLQGSEWRLEYNEAGGIHAGVALGREFEGFKVFPYIQMPRLYFNLEGMFKGVHVSFEADHSGSPDWLYMMSNHFMSVFSGRFDIHEALDSGWNLQAMNVLIFAMRACASRRDVVQESDAA